jgi:hypothetical protein
MKSLKALLLLLCLSALARALDEDHVEGAWLKDGVKWTNAPPGINPHLQAGQAEILYFAKDHSFAIIDCTLYRVPKQYETISHGDGRGVYLGKWEAAGEDIAVEYRLVDRTVKITGEALPGPTQHAKIRASLRTLRMQSTFHRAAGLDKDAAEVVGGLPQSSRITEGQKASTARKREVSTPTIGLDTLTMR